MITERQGEEFCLSWLSKIDVQSDSVLRHSILGVLYSVILIASVKVHRPQMQVL